MKDTNQVQKALEGKAKRELQRVVDTFVISLNKLNHEYHQPCSYTMRENRSTDAKVFFYIRPGCLETILHEMLIEAYLKPMVSKKTQQLLAKLELL